MISMGAGSIKWADMMFSPWTLATGRFVVRGTTKAAREGLRVGALAQARSHRQPKKPIVWALLAGASLTACAEEPVCGATPLSAAERSCVVNQISKKVRRRWVFAETKGVDLDAFAAELTAVASAGTDDTTFILDVHRMVAKLNDGHTSLTWSAAPWHGPHGRVRLRRVGDSIYVASRGEAETIKLGAELLEVDGRPIDEVLQEKAQYVFASNAPAREKTAMERLSVATKGAFVTLTTEQGAYDLTRRYSAPLEHSNAPPLKKRFGDYGYIRIHTFASYYIDDIDEFDRAINSLMQTRGVVIDLRENPGGTTSLANAMIGRLLDVESSYAPGSRGKTYEGEVVVLIDGHSASTSNHFAFVMDKFNRATLVGETTGGGSGVPEQTWHLLDDLSFKVSSRVLDIPGLVAAEEGVEPDIPVAFTVEELEQGLDSVWGEPARDKTLATALESMGWQQ